MCKKSSLDLHSEDGWGLVKREMYIELHLNLSNFKILTVCVLLSWSTKTQALSVPESHKNLQLASCSSSTSWRSPSSSSTFLYFTSCKSPSETQLIIFHIPSENLEINIVNRVAASKLDVNRVQ